MTAHEIVDQFPQLTRANVQTAVAYYWDYREEVEHALKRAREIGEANVAECLTPEVLKNRLHHL